ncbi:von Willebrand factor type A domain-containing protein [Microbulbifer donghaiensis]|uniref:von Willebrand factor type A domain-containing protein n=1 Tax=Microbulbifer donghaiensis TaxID=494016 RepID=A0A1M5D3I4_9GAMM|nr:vWA domain-containing protein [Microbulbifer donghaiensis]SHF61514.1 von Willebrand factor type A domain-containing protein [Microbulbifer donghaiensis]
MARKKRRFSTFSLSFLDIMSCGFGAVALIFLIIKHGSDHEIEVETQDLSAEVNLLQEEVEFGREHLVLARNTLDITSDELAEAQGLARRIIEQIEAVKGNIAEIDSTDEEEDIKRLQEKLKKLEQAKKDLEEENKKLGNNVRKYVGDGDRQYLTGLRLGGDRILILLDSSASMLGDELIKVIRTRNMSSRVKRETEKWRRAVNTVSWLTAQFPQDSQYQIFTFNTNFRAAISGTEDRWLNVDDRDQLDQAIKELGKIVPDGGTSLERVFNGINGMSPLPDNIILITDGLPTQGMKKPRATTISGRDRRDLFKRAVRVLPKNVPVNVILAPMEGDPFAASEFWKLAMETQGSFLAPSRDWP